MAAGAPTSRPATFNVKNMAYKSLLPDGLPDGGFGGDWDSSESDWDSSESDGDRARDFDSEEEERRMLEDEEDEEDEEEQEEERRKKKMEELSKLHVADLKDRLVKLGLDTDGKKADLIRRLTARRTMPAGFRPTWSKAQEAELAAEEAAEAAEEAAEEAAADARRADRLRMEAEIMQAEINEIRDTLATMRSLAAGWSDCPGRLSAALHHEDADASRWHVMVRDGTMEDKILEIRKALKTMRHDDKQRVTLLRAQLVQVEAALSIGEIKIDIKRRAEDARGPVPRSLSDRERKREEEARDREQRYLAGRQEALLEAKNRHKTAQVAAAKQQEQFEKEQKSPQRQKRGGGGGKTAGHKRKAQDPKETKTKRKKKK